MKNKPFRLTLIVTIAFILLVGIALLSFTYLNKSANANQATAMSAKDMAATQYTMDKITTNLQGASFVQIGLTLQADSKDARDELEQRKVQVKDTVNEILHTTTKVDLDKPDGHDKLKKEIMNSVNKFMTKGRVIDVYITEIVVQ